MTVSGLWFHCRFKYCTLWLFNVAMENGPFIDGLITGCLPMKNGDFPWLC